MCSTCKWVIMPLALINLSSIISAIMLEEGKTLTFQYPEDATNSPNNTYAFWDVQAPDGCLVVSITFQEVDAGSQLNGFTHVYFGDNATDLSIAFESCFPWARLTNENGRFLSKYRKFASTSPSVKLILSSMNTATRTNITFLAMKPEGNYVQEYSTWIYACRIYQSFEKGCFSWNISMLSHLMF